MPRQARVIVPNYPHHVLQRGHNKQAVFAEKEDYEHYLANLREAKQLFGVKAHAYCLMTNHVHLLLNPGESRESLGRFMKFIAGRQTRYANKSGRRSGTLWEGRFKSSPIESDMYLLACCRYIERNPVRAKMVASPEDYEWSSYQEKTGLQENGLVDPDPFYENLGKTVQLRQKYYREFIQQADNKEELQQIRIALQRGQLTGTKKFVDEVEKRIGLRIELRGRGRPKKVK